MGELPGRVGAVAGLAFSPDGGHVAACGEAGVQIWDVNTGVAVSSPGRVFGAVRGVAFSPGTHHLAVCNTAAKVSLWDRRTGEAHTLKGSPIAEGPLVFSPDGELLAAAGSPWTSSGGTVARLVKPVASRDMGCAVRLWNTATRAQRFQYESSRGGVLRLAFPPDGAFLVAGNRDGILQVVKWTRLGARPRQESHGPSPDWRHVQNQMQGHVGAISGLAFSPVASLLVSTGVDGTVRLWDPVGLQCLHVLGGHAGPVAAAGFSPDGALVVSVGSDATVRLWDAATGRSLQVLEGRTDHAPVAELSPYAPLLATGGADGVVRMWRWSSA
jgi:WD40 repeat protein